LQVSADEAVLGLPDVETSLLTLAIELEFVPGLARAIDRIEARCVGHVSKRVDNFVSLPARGRRGFAGWVHVAALLGPR
jgi:hypothetical protein